MELDAATGRRPGAEERAAEARLAGYAGTLVLRVGYRGTDFCGFAEQPGLRTVAGELGRAVSTLLRRPVVITCAGRTDAGVHALAQYVSIPVAQQELSLSGHTMLSALNALTPDDMSVSRVYRAPEGFSARFDALSRSYRYRIFPGPARPVLCAGHAWWMRHALDVGAMDEAARLLVGERDFKSFCKAASAEGKSTVREVLSCGVSCVEEAGERLVAVDVVGSAFLHSMVRTIAGTLVEVGRGHHDPTWVRDVLGACDRRAAGPCAPANGLTFVDVSYPEGLLVTWEDDC